MEDLGQFRHYKASSDWGEVWVPNLTAEDHRLISECYDRVVKKKIIKQAKKRNVKINIDGAEEDVPTSSEN